MLNIFRSRVLASEAISTILVSSKKMFFSPTTKMPFRLFNAGSSNTAKEFWLINIYYLAFFSGDTKEKKEGVAIFYMVMNYSYRFNIDSRSNPAANAVPNLSTMRVTGDGEL
jgi:hypothetical protein